LKGVGSISCGQSNLLGGNGGLSVVNAILTKTHAGAQIKGEFGVYAGSSIREMLAAI